MISDAIAKKLNAVDPVRQEVGLGDLIRAGMYAITYEVTTDATTQQTIPIPSVLEGMEAVLVIVQCRAASGGGTLTVRDGTNAITNAIACAVDTTIALSGTIDDTYSTITQSTSLNVIANGAADRGLVTIIGVPV